MRHLSTGPQGFSSLVQAAMSANWHWGPLNPWGQAHWLPGTQAPLVHGGVQVTGSNNGRIVVKFWVV